MSRDRWDEEAIAAAADAAETRIEALNHEALRGAWDPMYEAQHDPYDPPGLP